MENHPEFDHGLDMRIASRLKGLRQERGWSLDELAGRAGVSRATLSRLENAEVSPTASVLGRLCAAYGLTMSRLMLMVEDDFAPLVPESAQPVWVDASAGFRRRSVSPPAAALAGEVLACELDAGARIEYPQPPRPNLEHHLLMLEGALHITVDGRRHGLRPGDCLRYPEPAFSRRRRTAAPATCFHRLNHNVYRCYMPDHLASLRMATLSAAETETLLPELAELLHASVHAGASVSFVLPYSPDDALGFWRDRCCPAWPGRPAVGGRLAGRQAGRRGAARLRHPPNQPHRAEVRKLLVHPDFRRQGIARALMAKVEALAVAAGRSLITLDTRTGDRAEPLYASLGYVTVGVIPGFSRDSHDAHRLDGTTIMYKQL